MPFNVLTLPSLPISDVLEHIQQSLAQRHELVLEAPPGAGKTTLVPLALLDQPWLSGQRIIMLEPRRMAARAAAQRMASLINESPGQTVGFRVRQETKISKQTRIEVITEGILTRMLLQDPSLEGVGLLIFDEFHERSLDADVGLALALQSRQLFRDTTPLRLMLMSATLDGAAIADLLNDAPVIRSAGKMFPVELVYGKPQRYDDDLVERVVSALLSVITQHNEQHDSILVFLPGQGEINKVQRRLNDRLSAQDKDSIAICPLYGALPLHEQQRAINPLLAIDNKTENKTKRAKRKIVLATDIAETSLTIDGVNIVIDAGLCREPRFDPATGMSRLQTRRISKDSSIQRMGRAGRQAPGYCYRLWSEEQQYQLAQHSTAQILQADLAPLVLQLLAWGIDDVNELAWLDPPPPGPFKQAITLLEELGAIHRQDCPDKSPAYGHTHDNPLALKHLSLSGHGELMAAMPTHPRLAHMLLCSLRYQQIDKAAALAALLSDRNPLARGINGHASADLSQSLDIVMGYQPCDRQHQGWLKRTQQQAKTFKQLIKKESSSKQAPINVANKELQPDSVLGFLLACANPDRIAHRKPGSKTHYLLSNGRTAILDHKEPLLNSEWLAIAELGGHFNSEGKSSNDRIYSACSLDPALFDKQLNALLTEKDTLHWDENTDRLMAERLCYVGKLILKRRRIDNIPVQAKRTALIALLKKRGLDILPWSRSTRQWQARVMLLHKLMTEHEQERQAPELQCSEQQYSEQEWPDVSDHALLMNAEHWLGPYLDQVTKISDFQKLDLQQMLNNLLPWPLPQQLQELAPTGIKVPSGSTIAIDYTQTPPVLRVKLQEMFGCQSTPTIANGRIRLMLHLLSPAQRPLQVTQDLAGFWQSSYFDVKKDMKGRYPKHRWPDEPLLEKPGRSIKRK